MSTDYGMILVCISLSKEDTEQNQSCVKFAQTLCNKISLLGVSYALFYGIYLDGWGQPHAKIALQESPCRD